MSKVWANQKSYFEGGVAIDNIPLTPAYGLYSLCFLSRIHWYVPFVEITIRSSLHLRLANGLVTTVTHRMALLEQELLTLTEFLSSTSVFFTCGVGVVHLIKSHVMWCTLRFPRKNDVWFVFTQLCFVGSSTYGIGVVLQ